MYTLLLKCNPSPLPVLDADEATLFKFWGGHARIDFTLVELFNKYKKEQNTLILKQISLS